MLVTSHILAGAALGTLFSNRPGGVVIGFGVGVLSHYILDAVPHWERLFGPHYNNTLSKNHHDWPRHILVQGAMDLLVGVVLLRYFAFQANRPLAQAIFWGGIGGALPDIIDNAPFWSHMTKNLPFLKITMRVHRRVHIPVTKQLKLPKYTGLLTQLVICCSAAWFLIVAAGR
ncbi:MAG TPA: hypothetical protein VM124_01275 [Candidatus Limnocylindrales bacterium]|nr:hypothetical protein [Candidatus Limnocylindrales bacterium]